MNADHPKGRTAVRPDPVAGGFTRRVDDADQCFADWGAPSSPPSRELSHGVGVPEGDEPPVAGEPPDAEDVEAGWPGVTEP